MKNKSQKATVAMTAILTASTVINPMAVSAYAQDTDTAVIGQQSEQDVPKPQKEDTNLQKQEESPAVVDPEENTSIKNSDKQTDTETPSEEDPAVEPEVKKQEAPNRMYRSIPTPKVVEAIKINEVNFPDETFRNWVLGKEYGTDGKLTADEIANIKEIYVSEENGITDLKGIEYFTALEKLYCAGIDIASLDVSKNRNLKKLDCSFTKITSLDVSNNDLEELRCDNTGITGLDVSNNPNLKYLDCSNTKITSLDVSKNPVLETLSCTYTGVTSLDVSKNLALTGLYCENTRIKSLDVSKNRNLVTLNCNATKITSLDVTKNPDLISLWCNGTQITSLDVSKNHALMDLYCKGAWITSLDVSKNEKLFDLQCDGTKITSLDVSNNTALVMLDCSNTEITSLDVSKNKDLDYLYCSKTKITNLDVSNNPDLRTLNCSNTEITSLDVSNNPKLETLKCENCSLAWVNIGDNPHIDNSSITSSSTISLEMVRNTFNVEEVFPGIDKLKISAVSGASYDAKTGIFSNYSKDKPIVYTYDCGTSKNGTKTIEVTINLTGYIYPIEINEENFPDKAFRNWVLEKEYGIDRELTADEIANIKDLYIDIEEITDLKGIEYFTALEELYCTYTGITSLDVSKNRNLKILDCSVKGLNSLNVSNNPALEELTCNNTGITSLDVSKNPNLKYLSCFNTKITSLDVSKNPVLETLSCSYTGVTSLNVSKNLVLTGLYCENTRIKSLDVSKNRNLVTLNCNATKITSLDVTKNPDLISLWCNGTQITSLDVSKNHALMDLYCKGAWITSLDVSKNEKLFDLQCDGTKITTLDVSNNTALANLNCSNTEITSLDVSKNKELTGLYCSNTKITSLDVSNNTDLVTLDCSNTEITGLDVSNNNLYELKCENCPLAWVNISGNLNLDNPSITSSTTISLEMIKDSFNIEEEFPGIDKSKISNVSGANYDASTGVFSNYNKGTPIVYTYDCGTSKNGKKTIEVTINLTNLIINEKNFPDEAFRNWVLGEGYGIDGELTEDEIIEVREIDVHGNKEIRNLKGLEHFTALKNLNCSETGITSLDVNKNPDLINLNCSNTKITSLNISNNLSLKALFCFDTSITTLDVNKNKELVWLFCSNTGIKSLDVSNNSSLKILDCSSNVDLSILNLSNTQALDDLICSNTSIKTLDVSDSIALKNINCSKTGITSLDVSNNKALIYLNCSFNKDMTTLDVRNTKALETLFCSNTNIKTLNVSDSISLKNMHCSSNKNMTTLNVNNTRALEELDCSGTGITTLDVSNSTVLKTLICADTKIEKLNISNTHTLETLDCSGTGITALDVSNSTVLRTLNCANTKIEKLNISNNQALETLDCSRTEITSLDIRNNTALIDLNCFNTGITSLDVSRNTDLKILNCDKCPLAWLNIGDNTSLSAYISPNLPISLDMTEDTFNITDKFPEIDITKVSNVNGADFENGTFSNYHRNIPIKYTYDCGTASTGNITLQVTLNLIGYKEKSTISLAKLDKVYDEKPVNPEQAVTKTGSSGTVTFKWEKKIGNDNWTTIASAPTNVGIYRVTATVAADDDYREATSEPKEFEIKQATNAWQENLSIEDWIYLEEPKKPSAKAKFGKVTYSYSDPKTGTVSEEVPTTAGTWCVKATVAETENYKKLEATKTFTIAKAPSTICITESLDKTYDGKSVNSEPMVRKAGSSGNVTYVWEKKNSDNTWETIASAPTDAGMYRVTANLEFDNNYLDAKSEPKEFTIEKANSTISIKDRLDKTYDGNAVSSNPTFDSTGSAGKVTYKWEKKMDDNTWKTIPAAPTNAGTYRVIATLLADKNYKEASSEPKEFTIAKAPNKWLEDLSIEGWTYLEKPKNPSAKAEYGTPVYSYSNLENGEFKADVPSNAGTWYVKATVITENYEKLEDTIEFTIEKADSTISITDSLDKTYDGKAVNADQVAETTGSNGTISYRWEKRLEDNTWEEMSSAPINVGNYRVIAKLAADNNYKEAYSAPVEFTITQATNEWKEQLSIKDWKYQDTENKPSASAKFGTPVFTYSDSETGKFTADVPTTIGTWYVKAVVAGNENYTGIEAVQSFTIEKADSIIHVIDSLDKTYDERAVDEKPKVTIKGSSGRVSYKWEKRMGNNWVVMDSAPMNAGTYRVTAVLAGDDNFNETSSEPKVFRIAQAPNAWVENLSIMGWTYQGAMKQPSASAKYGTPVFTYSNSKDGIFTSKVPTTAGTWYVKATVITENYEKLEVVQSFTIEPKHIEEDSEILVPEITPETKLDDLSFQDGDKVLVQGTDYIVTKKQDGNKVTVTIIFKGNYRGEITKTYTVDEDKGSANTDQSVDTGDTTHTGLWATFLALSGGFIALLTGKKRKKAEDK